MPPRRLAGRLLLLAVLAAVLAVGWLAVSSIALSSLDDVCMMRAPAESSVTQDGEIWPPTLACHYTTASSAVTTREDGEVRGRLIAIAISGVLAVAAWALVAYRVLRPRVAPPQDHAAEPRP